jgi:ribonuclease BN (tRNA processing enzyme)
MGFPFFAPIYAPSTRILIDGYPTCMKGLRIPFDNKMGDGIFPIAFNDLRADIRYLGLISRGPLHVDDVIIEAIPLQHPQGGFGYRFREGSKSVVFITDNELTAEPWARSRPEDFIRFCKGADILIHDSQYTPEERQKRKGWGHSDYASVVDLAAKSQVGRLILFHHDPSRTDLEMVSFRGDCLSLAKEKNVPIQIDAAREESEISV